MRLGALQPSGIEFTLQLIQRLAIPYEDYTFIDFGCGKGRTLLLASHFPFRRIIGVEFSKELTAIAERNLRTYQSPERQCQDLSAVWADVAAYEMPDGPLVVYSYNSFDGVILKRALENIARSFEAQPRELLFVYANPIFRSELDDAGFLSCTAVWDHGHVVVYRNALAPEIAGG
jgi:SAM-dependent methyltransferase